MLSSPCKLMCVEDGTKRMSEVCGALDLLEPFLTPSFRLAGHGGDGEQPPAASGPERVEGPERERAAARGHQAAGHGGGQCLRAG